MKRSFGHLFTLAVPLAIAGYAIAWTFNLLPAGLQPSSLKMNSGSGLVYDTAAVTTGEVRKIISTAGPVRALVTVSVGSELSGLINNVKVDFNTAVNQGDVLATLDRRTFEARVLQAKADLAAAEATLNNQTAALAKSEAALKLAERNIERQKPLVQKGFTSQTALDQTVRDVEVGRADIAVGKAAIQSAEATVAQRKAQLKVVEIDLERSEIKAPISGTVISRTVDPGQTVAASFQAPELFKIAQDLSRIRIEAQVNEADVGAIEAGNPVTFTVDAYPDRQFEGRVTQVRLAATEINNVVTYTVIIEAANEDRKLFPGMTATAQIEAAKKENVLRLANDVLRYKPKDASPAEGQGHGGDSTERTNRLIERLKGEVALTSEQETAVRDALAKFAQEAKASQPSGSMGGPPIDPLAMRQRISARVDQALGPLLSAEQKILYERYKKGREGTRGATVWVLDSKGAPEARFVRLGLSDGQFTEIVGGDVTAGANLIVRSKEPPK